MAVLSAAACQQRDGGGSGGGQLVGSALAAHWQRVGGGHGWGSPRHRHAATARCCDGNEVTGSNSNGVGTVRQQ